MFNFDYYYYTVGLLHYYYTVRLIISISLLNILRRFAKVCRMILSILYSYCVSLYRFVGSEVLLHCCSFIVIDFTVSNVHSILIIEEND